MSGNTDPEDAPRTRSTGELVRRVVAVVWVVVCGIEFVIWLLMTLISGSFKAPFWLWTIGIGGVALLLWWYLDPARRDREESE